MDTAEQYTKNGHKVTIFYDETGDNSPRDWDNLGNLFCFHRRYNIGDPHQYDSSDFTSFEDWKNQIQKDYKVIAILPVYMFDHSGVSISTTPFGCRWDSGQIGWIFTTPEKIKEIGAEQDKALQYLENEIKIYNQFLAGEVYGYLVEKIETCNLGHEHTEEIQQCSGYYSIDEAKEEAESYIPEN